MNHHAVPLARLVGGSGISFRQIAMVLVLSLTVPMFAIAATAAMPVLMLVCLAEAVRNFYFVGPQRHRSSR